MKSSDKHVPNTHSMHDEVADGCRLPHDGTATTEDGTGHIPCSDAEKVQLLTLIMTSMVASLVAGVFEPEFYVTTGSFVVLGASLALSLVGTVACFFELLRKQRSRFHEEVARIRQDGSDSGEVPTMKQVFRPLEEVPRARKLPVYIWVASLPVPVMLASLATAALRPEGLGVDAHIFWEWLGLPGELTVLPLMAQFTILFVGTVVYTSRSLEYDRILRINATGSADEEQMPEKNIFAD